ncbi:hypothetical protein D3C84_481840 [compost metagenome]
MVFRGKEQADEAIGTHTANADRLDGNVLEAVAVEEHPPFVRQRQPVILQGFTGSLDEALLIDMKKYRRLIDQAPAPCHFTADLGIEVIADTHPGLCHQLLAEFLELRIGCRINDGLGIQAVIPDLQWAELRQFTQAFPVGTHTLDSGSPCLFVSDLVIARGHDKTDRQAFYIPLPGSRKRFVEIVDVKYQVALGCREQPEVQQVAVPAGLYLDASVRGDGQVMGH